MLRGAPAAAGGDAAHPPGGHRAARRRRRAAGRGRRRHRDRDRCLRRRAARPSCPAWREVEVELGAGDEALAAAVGERLVRGGRPAVGVGVEDRPRARRPAGRAAVRRGRAARSGPRGRRRGVPARRARRPGGRRSQAADVLLRTEQPDAVHQVRVAARRLRSTLAAFRPVLDATTVTEPLRDELSWLGGAARRRPGRRGGAGPPARGGARPSPRNSCSGRSPPGSSRRSSRRCRPGATGPCARCRSRGTSACSTPCTPARRSAVHPGGARSRCGRSSRDATRRSVKRLRRRLEAARAGGRATPRRRPCTRSARRPSGLRYTAEVGRGEARARQGAGPRRQAGADRCSGSSRTPSSPGSSAAGSGWSPPRRGRTPSPTAGCTPRTGARGPRRGGLLGARSPRSGAVLRAAG